MQNIIRSLFNLGIIFVIVFMSISFAAPNDFYIESRKIDRAEIKQELEKIFPGLKEDSKDELSEKEKKEIVLDNHEAKVEECVVNIIWANLNSPTISADVAYANQGIGAVATLDQIVKAQDASQGKIMAAINGGYFEIGGDRQSYGTYFKNGNVIHVGDIGSLATFGSKNEFSTMPVATIIEGAINGQWEKPYSFRAWNINHFMNSNDAVLIFNSLYKGVKPPHDYTTITVVNNIVNRIDQGSFNIPYNGFLIMLKDPKIIKKFKVGDRVDYRFSYYKNNYTEEKNIGKQLYLHKIKTGLGAGPILVKNSEVVADPVKEKFFENKINATAAKRSFIGVTDYNMLAMVTTDKLTMQETAVVAKMLGLVDAFNLDGGGSSSLFYNGNYLVESKRKIANALVIKSHADYNRHLFVNDKEVFSDNREIVKELNNKVYVLASELAKGIDSSFSYSPLSKKAEMFRYQMRYTIDTNNSTIEDGTKTVSLDTLAADNKFDLYLNIEDLKKIIPMESIYTANQGTLRVHLKTLSSTLASAKYLAETKKYEAAAELYEKALEMDYKNITTLTALGDIYSKKLKDAKRGITFYDKALKYSPNDAYIINAKANALSKTN